MVLARRPRTSKPFRAFLRALPPEDSPEGEFIAAAQADRSFPDLETWQELRSYLHRTGSINVEAVAARTVWRRYRNTLRKT